MRTIVTQLGGRVTKMLHETKVLIVGAGAAGFSAAARLLEKGIQDVTILEAKNRIGGRIHTVKFGSNVVELGAQWVHGETNNVVFNIASPHHVLDSSRNFHALDNHIFVTPHGEVVPINQSAEALKTYYEISDELSNKLKNADGSYGEHFRNEYFKVLEKNPFVDYARGKQFLDWIEKFDNSIQCSDSWFDVSAKGITEYWQCEGDLLLNWKHYGYKTLFALLSHKIPDASQDLSIETKVQFCKDVSLIDYTEHNKVIVKTKDGSTYKASHVVVTTSLGVLKEKHSAMFLPALSEKKQLAIKGLSIGSVNKIFLEFSHSWWNVNTGSFGLIWSTKQKTAFLQAHGLENSWLCDVFSFFTVDYQPQLLCAWITGESARYIETLTDLEVKNALYLLLKMFLGKAHDVTMPSQILRSKWYTDEHFRGCYSFRSIDSEQLNVNARDLAEPIHAHNGKPIILFAGEATHDHYYSTVHGAVETGFREADRIIEYEKRLKSHL